MTTVTEVLNTAASAVPLRRPLVFDLVAHFEPSAHYRFSRRVRNEFDRMAKAYSRSTWLLGRYGGRPVMQSDIQGIGVASRVEIGRLVLREGNQLELLASALRMFRECQDQDLASGSVSRILVHFNRAEERHDERKLLLASHQEVFGDTCAFRTWDEHALELGHCVEYQTLIQYLREDGLYHSTHRNRVDQVQRHLSQEVGRYENHKFFVLPQEIPGGGPPSLKFCYTGDEGADARVEAFMEGYTQEKLTFVDPAEYTVDRSRYAQLEDYERASRRFGGKWILQGDLVRHLPSQHVAVLYLFFDKQMNPELEREFGWDELFARQARSRHVDPASRQSQTYLDMVLEGLERDAFIEVMRSDRGVRCRLASGFADYRHVTFYELGEYRKRQF